MDYKMDNTLVLDKAITLEGCQEIINKYQSFLIKDKLDSHLGYEYYDIIDSPALGILAQSIMNKYIEYFPDINLTADPWDTYTFRLKHFPPGYSFSSWHSEHNFQNPYRIASIMIYLTDHQTGTEFTNGEVIRSVPGRAVVFPTSWTHTHRGQVCPEGKSRYVLTSYVNIRPRSDSSN